MISDCHFVFLSDQTGFVQNAICRTTESKIKEGGPHHFLSLDFQDSHAARPDSGGPSLYLYRCVSALSGGTGQIHHPEKPVNLGQRSFCGFSKTAKYFFLIYF